jgi:hypothetical protein
MTYPEEREREIFIRWYAKIFSVSVCVGGGREGGGGGQGARVQGVISNTFERRMESRRNHRDGRVGGELLGPCNILRTNHHSRYAPG